VGAAEAFLKVLFQAASQYAWKVHAYVLMRNHFHLALETEGPTLVEGMHWLQSTLATRFNRYRDENGHLFQGRYRAILVEDYAAMGRLADYIHLNPVRAKVVAVEHLGGYRWSSLPGFLRGPREARLAASSWLEARGGWSDDAEGWKAYWAHLSAWARNEAGWKEAGLTELSKGWAIGTAAWRRAMAKEYEHLALSPGFEREEIRELREEAWRRSFDQALAEHGRQVQDLTTRPRKQVWKLAVARRTREESGAPLTWLAERLLIGKPATLRSYLHEANQQTTAFSE
jgi:putative transposase